jgi:integrase
LYIYRTNTVQLLATIKFLYRSVKDVGAITIRLAYRHEKRDFTLEAKTPITISRGDWELLATPKRIKDAALKNKKLEIEQETSSLEHHVLSAFNRTSASSISKAWLTRLVEDHFSIGSSNDVPQTVVGYFPRFLKGVKNQISPSTSKRYNTAFGFLKKFAEDTGIDPRIDEVDSDFQQAIEEYCARKQYAVNTIAKYLSIIKTVCRYALRHDNILLSPRFQLIKSKSHRTPIIYLSFDDLKLIRELPDDALGPRLSNVRDWLIISCYTGQRISDFMKFKTENIREDDGVKVMDIIQQKGDKQVTVPLFEPVLQILEKYQGGFPRRLSDQKFNEYAKEVAKLAGIDNLVHGGKVVKDSNGSKRKEFGKFPKHELVTSHVGRRSFATNFYGKIPTPLIMNVTGHSKESTFLGYIGKTSRDTAVETAKAYKNLNLEL